MGRSKKSKALPKLKNCDPNSPITREALHEIAKGQIWPSHHTRKAVKQQITDVRQSQPDNQIIGLPRKDITDSSLGLRLAKEFEPQITLLGRGLRSEIKSDTWGNLFLFMSLSKNYDSS